MFGFWHAWQCDDLPCSRSRLDAFVNHSQEEVVALSLAACMALVLVASGLNLFMANFVPVLVPHQRSSA